MIIYLLDSEGGEGPETPTKRYQTVLGESHINKS